MLQRGISRRRARILIFCNGIIITILVYIGARLFISQEHDCSLDAPLIPNHIWQTTPSYDVPAEMNAFISTWSTRNPGWAHTIFDDEAAAAFLARNFDAETLKVYTDFPLGVMKVSSPRLIP